jgi:2-amino-4-hydroxy-6-hydroxymethyldihydropteridine diphosphokinase
MRAAIALGSNLGERENHLHAAITGIRKLSAPDQPFLVSRFYVTTPVDCPVGSDDFVNAAVELTPLLTPIDLMRALKAIEAVMGRPDIRAINGPRPIDLDIIYYGDFENIDPDLTLPHPRALIRRFVLAPLADIVPDHIFPGTTRTIRDQLANLPPDNTLRLL